MTVVVDIEGLSKTFTAHRAVREVTFQVARGEIFGFLGPNGAGKSTTIRLMLGLYRPTSGRVRILGRDPAREAVAVLRSVGYLPGEVALHPRLTGRVQLDRYAHARGLTDRTMRDELIRRFDVELDRPVHTLSKGNRQKIAIVAAFMHRPELLVLDEPTSGLDPLLQNEFDHLLRETADDGRTVFLSSHDLDEVQRVVDRLAVIKDGEIVVTDTVDGLRGRAARTFEFRFGSPVDPQAFAALDGVRVTVHDANRIVLAVSGPIAELLRLAASRDAVDVIARPADLDELFLSYYRNTENGPHGR